MNSPRIRIAIEKVYKELSNLSRNELLNKIKKHGDGDFTKILRESGALNFYKDKIMKKPFDPGID